MFIKNNGPIYLAIAEKKKNLLNWSFTENSAQFEQCLYLFNKARVGPNFVY